jgi:hypothetical protein
MKTIRIGQLDLKCRGVHPVVARAALRELHSALARQLSASDAEDQRPSAQPQSGPIRLSSESTPAALANAVASRVATTVRARTTYTGGGRPS